MVQKSLKAEVERMLGEIADEKVRTQVTKALNYVDDPPRHLLVAYGVVRARESGYKELALELARLAYEHNPEDPHLLIELCNSLDQPQNVVSEIEQFGRRVKISSLPADQREKIMVSLAAAYKGMGRTAESVKILEESKIELARGIELLAEQYYQTGQTQKAINLLYERLKWVGKLSEGMASWLSKSFDTTGDYTQAMQITEKFQEDALIKPIYEKARKQLGFKD